MNSVASESQSLITNSANAAETYEQTTANKLSMAKQDYAAKAHTFNQSVIGSLKTQADAYSTGNLAYANSTLLAVGTFAANAKAPHLTAAQGSAGAHATFATSSELALHTFNQGGITSEAATYDGLMDDEDPPVIKTFRKMVAARRVPVWQRAVDFQHAPAAFFANMTPRRCRPRHR